MRMIIKYDNFVLLLIANIYSDFNVWKILCKELYCDIILAPFSSWGNSILGTWTNWPKSSSWEILWVETLWINLKPRRDLQDKFKKFSSGWAVATAYATGLLRGTDNACLWMGHEFPSFLGTTTTAIPPTNPRVSEAPAFFSKSWSNTLLWAQELSAVLNN